MSHRRYQTPAEEVANSITHGLGLLASLIGLPALIIVAADHGDPWVLVGYCVFAVTLVALYAASTMYHALPRSRAKDVFHRLDHAAIYLLIAGTYTPFTLGVLRGAWGWTLFGIIWALAVAGVIYKTVVGVRLKGLSTALYVAMGWLVIIAIRPLTASLPAEALAWLVAGGLFYTGGVAFYVWDRLRFGHTVWHLFVLGGSICHFIAVLRFAAPLTS